jgi:hypothetical protein
MNDPQKYIEIFNEVKSGFSAGREVVAFAKDVAPSIRRGVQLINERLFHQREEAIAETLSEVPPILERREVIETVDPPPKFLIPWFEAASNDTAPELRDLWASLLASALDPVRSKAVRLSFIDTIKQLDPLDVLVLRKRHEHLGGFSQNANEYLRNALNRSVDEIEISIDHLEKLGCIGHGSDGRAQFFMLPYGRELVRVCSD